MPSDHRRRNRGDSGGTCPHKVQSWGASFPRPHPYTRAFHASGRMMHELAGDEEAKRRNHRCSTQGGARAPPTFLASTHVYIIHVYSHALLSLSAPPTNSASHLGNRITKNFRDTRVVLSRSSRLEHVQYPQQWPLWARRGVADWDSDTGTPGPVARKLPLIFECSP